MFYESKDETPKLKEWIFFHSYFFDGLPLLLRLWMSRTKRNASFCLSLIIEAIKILYFVTNRYAFVLLVAFIFTLFFWNIPKYYDIWTHSKVLIFCRELTFSSQCLPFLRILNGKCVLDILNHYTTLFSQIFICGPSNFRLCQMLIVQYTNYPIFASEKLKKKTHRDLFVKITLYYVIIWIFTNYSALTIQFWYYFITFSRNNK